MINKVISRGKIFALVIDVATEKSGSHPATNPAWPIQMLLTNRKAGHVVAKHMHKKVRKSSAQPQEALVVVKGALQASIFDRKGKFLAKKNVRAGQCLLLVDGAHEVKFTKNSLVYAF